MKNEIIDTYQFEKKLPVMANVRQLLYSPILKCSLLRFVHPAFVQCDGCI